MKKSIKLFPILLILFACSSRNRNNNDLVSDSYQKIDSVNSDTIENKLLLDILESKKNTSKELKPVKPVFVSSILLHELDLYNQYKRNEELLKQNYSIDDSDINYYMQLLIDEGFFPIPHVLDTNLKAKYLSYSDYKEYRSRVSFDSLSKIRAYKVDYPADTLEKFITFSPSSDKY